MKWDEHKSIEMFTRWTFEQIWQTFASATDLSTVRILCMLSFTLCWWCASASYNHQRFGTMIYCYLILYLECLACISISLLLHYKVLQKTCVCVFVLPPQRHRLPNCLVRVCVLCTLIWCLWSTVHLLVTDKTIVHHVVLSLFTAHRRLSMSWRAIGHLLTLPTHVGLLHVTERESYSTRTDANDQWGHYMR